MRLLANNLFGLAVIEGQSLIPEVSKSARRANQKQVFYKGHQEHLIKASAVVRGLNLTLLPQQPS
jgi:hypothetical protein